MKRLLLLVAALACLGLVLPVKSVQAAPVPPDHDSYVYTIQPVGVVYNTTDPTNLAVGGSTASCNATYITYLQWDLSSLAAGQTLTNASVALTANAVTSASSATLALYSVPASWTEGTLVWSNAPGLPLAGSALLATQPAPAVGNSITFSSQALVDYLNTGTGAPGPDRKASFALAFSAGCAAGLSFVRFNSEESTGTKPDLQIEILPTAVTLQSFGGVSTSSAGEAWPWVAVLGLVAALIVLFRRHYLPTN